jgi:uncharacterized protein YjaG (DUF416 family)
MAIKEINQLKKLTPQKHITFSYLCCERFYPNYLFFSENYNFGNPAVMRSAIDLIYDSIFDKNISRQKIETILQTININAPRPDDFSTFYASIAMYTSGIIYESTNLILLKDIERILEDISTMCTDAVDLFIQERDDMDYDQDNFEAKILIDPLMQSELRIQRGTVTYLKKIDRINEADINILLKLQEENTKPLTLIANR